MPVRILRVFARALGLTAILLTEPALGSTPLYLQCDILLTNLRDNNATTHMFYVQYEIDNLDIGGVVHQKDWRDQSKTWERRTDNPTIKINDAKITIDVRASTLVDSLEIDRTTGDASGLIALGNNLEHLMATTKGTCKKIPPWSEDRKF